MPESIVQTTWLSMIYGPHSAFFFRGERFVQHPRRRPARKKLRSGPFLIDNLGKTASTLLTDNSRSFPALHIDSSN